MRLPEHTVAVVTGSSSGIGAAVAELLASSCDGLVLNARDSGRLDRFAATLRSRHPGVRVAAVAGDAAEPATVARLCAAAAELGGCSIAVANAGGGTAGRTVATITGEQLLQTYGRNVVPAALLMQGVAAQMTSQGYGRIVTVASVAGKMGSPTAGPDYAAAKAALISLTRSAAREWGPSGITVNAVAPGVTMTERLRERIDRMEPDTAAAVLADIPLRRWGTPEDIAAAVGFLASPRAGYITGAVLDVNGGHFMG